MGTAVMQDSPNLGGLVGVCGPGCEPLYQVPCPPARVRPAWAEGQRLGTGAVQAGRLVHIQGSLSSGLGGGEKGGTGDPHGSACFPTRMEAHQHSSTRCDHSVCVCCPSVQWGQRNQTLRVPHLRHHLPRVHSLGTNPNC